MLPTINTGDPQAEAFPVLTPAQIDRLWVRAYSGLFRCDGVQFVRWSAQSGEELPSTSVNSMLGARDGSLWVGTEAGLAHLVNGRLTLYEKGRASAPRTEERDGKIWFLHVRPGDRTHPLCQVLQAEVHCYGMKTALIYPVPPPWPKMPTEISG